MCCCGNSVFVGKLCKVIGKIRRDGPFLKTTALKLIGNFLKAVRLLRPRAAKTIASSRAAEALASFYHLMVSLSCACRRGRRSSPTLLLVRPSAYVSMRQHTSEYVNIRQHMSAYVSIRCNHRAGQLSCSSVSKQCLRRRASCSTIAARSSPPQPKDKHGTASMRASDRVLESTSREYYRVLVQSTSQERTLRPQPKDKHVTASMRASDRVLSLLRNAHSRTRESARERATTRESARASDQRFSKCMDSIPLERFGTGAKEGKGSHTSDYLTTPVFLRPNTPPTHHRNTHNTGIRRQRRTWRWLTLSARPYGTWHFCW